MQHFLFLTVDGNTPIKCRVVSKRELGRMILVVVVVTTVISSADHAALSQPQPTHNKPPEHILSLKRRRR